MMSYNKFQKLFCLLTLFVLFGLTPRTDAAITQPLRQTKQYMYAYGGPTPLVRPLLRRKITPKKQSLWNEVMSKVGPAILGSGGVILGAVVAWYTLRRKTKAFDGYFERIARAQEKYQQTITAGTVDRDKALHMLKTELVSIQEEVEMAVARKKLDQEQLIAVSNKIERILNKK